MKKKLISLFLVFALVVATVLTIVACTNEPDASGIEAIIAEGQNMTTAELLAKAKTEKGNFTVYGTSSRIADAMKGFLAKYGEELGLTDQTASYGSKSDDSSIYTTLMNEYVSANNSKGASMALLQDGAQLYLYRSASKMLQNYVPSTVKDKLQEGEALPLVHQYINKLFMWNKTGSGANIEVTNVWQLVDDTFMGDRTIYFKSPKNEQVNMNFLVMLTSKDWSDKLAAAYKKLYNKDIVLDADCPNAGYQWVKMFVSKSSQAINSDGTICTTINQDANAGNMGLFVLSKIRSLETNNLQVAAWQEKDSKLVSVDPFAGFMYPIYAQVMTNGPRPFTAMLFINYIMEKEGFNPWGKDFGAYSPNTDITVNEGDRDIAFWRERLVIEDPAYLQANKAEVTDFVSKLLG